MPAEMPSFKSFVRERTCLQLSEFNVQNIKRSRANVFSFIKLLRKVGSKKVALYHIALLS